MDLKSLLSTLNQGATGTGTAPQTGPKVPAKEPVDLAASSSSAADVYHGSSAAALPSPPAQTGIGAYIQLLNALAASERQEKSADLLLSNLGNASAALKLAYHEALSRLPAPLQQQDWGLSVSNGELVFIVNEDQLSAQDLSDLRKAFAGSGTEPAAQQVIATITSIEQARKSGTDSGSLAWGRFGADETNFGDTVDLRAYVTGSPPGGNYKPDAGLPASHSQVPAMLGGMDLRTLLTARPDFLQPNGAVRTQTLNALDTPPEEHTLVTLQGRCSCGEVHFTVEDVFEYAFYCHCSRCRSRTGSVFAAIAGVALDKLEVTLGRESLLIEGECPDGYGARCSRCHAFLFAAVRDRQYAHVSLGALVDTPGRVPDHHIYVGSKAPWYQITDALPQYEELPSSPPQLKRSTVV